MQDLRSKEAEIPGDSSHDEVETVGGPIIVDKITERKLMAKLDSKSQRV